MLKDVLHVKDSFFDVKTLDGASCVVSVLKVGSEVGNLSLGSYKMKFESLHFVGSAGCLEYFTIADRPFYK